MIMTHFKMKKTNAILKDANPRKEFNGDEKVLATDLSLQIVMPGSILTELTDTKAAWEFFCWDQSTEEVRPNGMDHFALSAHFDAHVLHVSIGDKTMTFEDVTLKKFKAKPIDGKRVEMTFQAQVYPTKGQLADLAEMMMEQVKIKIDAPRQRDLVEETNGIFG
jgi:hypothetical protein